MSGIEKFDFPSAAKTALFSLQRQEKQKCEIFFFF